MSTSGKLRSGRGEGRLAGLASNWRTTSLGGILSLPGIVVCAEEWQRSRRGWSQGWWMRRQLLNPSGNGGGCSSSRSVLPLVS